MIIKYLLEEKPLNLIQVLLLGVGIFLKQKCGLHHSKY